MSDWRDEVRALAALGPDAEFPLLVFRASPTADSPWPSELAPPSAEVLEFYRLCDGGYFGGHHRLLPVGELLAENRRWWEMLADGPAPDGEPLDAACHVVLGCDACGFPLVWDSRTDLLARLDYRDTGALLPLGQTLGQFMGELFGTGYDDGMWREALRQLRGNAQDAEPGAAPDTAM